MNPLRNRVEELLGQPAHHCAVRGFPITTWERAEVAELCTLHPDVEWLVDAFGTVVVEASEAIWGRAPADFVDWGTERRVVVLPGLADEVQLGVFKRPAFAKKLRQASGVPLLHVSGREELLAAIPTACLRVSWDDDDYEGEVRFAKHAATPLDVVAAAVEQFYERVRLVSTPSEELVELSKKSRFRGKQGRRALEALAVKPEAARATVLPELICSLAKTPELALVLPLAPRRLSAELETELVAAFQVSEVPGQVLSTLVERQTAPDTLAPLVGAALNADPSSVETAIWTVFLHRNAPAFRELQKGVAGAIREDRAGTNLAVPARALAFLSTQGSPEFDSTLAAVQRRLAPHLFHFVLRELLHAGADRERLRALLPGVDFPTPVEPTPPSERPDLSGLPPRSSALNVRDASLFVAGAFYREFLLVRRYTEALREQGITSIHVPSRPERVRTYGEAIWQRVTTGLPGVVRAIVDLDPGDEVHPLVAWACFVLQRIEQFVSLPQDVDAARLLTALRQSNGAESLEQALDSLGGASRERGPVERERRDRARDLDLILDGRADAERLRADIDARSVDVAFRVG